MLSYILIPYFTIPESFHFERHLSKYVKWPNEGVGGSRTKKTFSMSDILNVLIPGVDTECLVLNLGSRYPVLK